MSKQHDAAAMPQEQLDAVAGGIVRGVIITAVDRRSEVGFQGCIPTDPCPWSPDRYGVSSRKHEASVKPNRRGGYGRHTV